MTPKYRYVYTLVYFVTVGTMVILLIWFGIRQTENQWGIATECIPVNYSAASSLCGSEKNIWRCYKGTMVVSADSNGTALYYDVVDPQSSAMTIEEAIEQTQEHYPPEHTFKCWYNELYRNLRF